MTRKFLALFVAATMALTYSCKKDKDTEAELDSQTKQFNDDSNNYKAESDQSNNDVNSAVGDIPAFGRGVKPPGVLSSPLCGATIDSSQLSQKIITINFDGQTPCFSPSRTRSGSIKVELTSGQFWSEAGAVLTITYTNFKITRLSDNKSIQFNGSKTLENVNGHDWLAFLAGTSTVEYRERAFNIAVAFNDGSTATWNSARFTKWSYNPSDTKLTFTALGDSAISGHNKTDSWGTNRFGYDFVTYYNTDIISNTYCGLWRPNSGELVHNVSSKDYVLTLGCDQNGNPTPYACAYGFKITWTPTGGSQTTLILSY